MLSPMPMSHIPALTCDTLLIPMRMLFSFLHPLIWGPSELGPSMNGTALLCSLIAIVGDVGRFDVPESSFFEISAVPSKERSQPFCAFICSTTQRRLKGEAR